MCPVGANICCDMLLQLNPMQVYGMEGGGAVQTLCSNVVLGSDPPVPCTAALRSANPNP